MKFSYINKNVLKSNLLVIISVAITMLFCFLFLNNFILVGTNFILQILFAVSFAVYVEWRIVYKKQRIAVFLSSVMIVFATMLIPMKHNFFLEYFVISRYCWYAEYISYILIPLFIVYTSMYVGNENIKMNNIFIAIFSTISWLLIILIMTNDIHQCMFKFNEGFVNWDVEYKWGFLFYITYIWMGFLFVTALVMLVKKCRIMIGKKYSWLVILYAGFTSVFTVVDSIFNIQKIVFSNRLISSLALYCAMAISFLLTCVRLWLIPAEKDYYELNDAIKEVNEQLQEESEIIRLRNKLKNEQITIKENSDLYDKIAESVSSQTAKILDLTENYDNLPVICFFGAYIKRLSNLKLIAYNNPQMSVCELIFAVRESAKYLENIGIPIMVSGFSERFLSSYYIVETYKCMQLIVENNLEKITGIYINFPISNSVIMRVVLDGVNLPNDTADLSGSLQCIQFSEDGVSYVSFNYTKGGENYDTDI